MSAHQTLQPVGTPPVTLSQPTNTSMLKRLLETIFVMVLLALVAPASAQQYIAQWQGGAASGWARAFVDANGDGRDDYCYLAGDVATANHTELHCHLTKTSGAPEFQVMATGLWAHDAGLQISSSIRWADLNGDGFVDLCRAVHRGPAGNALVCRLGPGFGAATSFTIPWVLAECRPTSPWSCTGYSGIVSGETSGTGLDPETGRRTDIPRFYLADVSGDGVSDLCFVWQEYESSAPRSPSRFELRCRIAVVGANRGSVVFQEVTQAWTFVNVNWGLKTYINSEWQTFPDGFHDFDGDGRADFCRFTAIGTPTVDVLRCTVAGQSGFSHEVTSLPIDRGSHQGASFVDINADGNIDYCRLVGVQISCALSDGLTWRVNDANNHNVELVSPALHAGHEWSRWWVDINVDGYPDFCRLSANPNPIGDGVTDVNGNLLCRLSRGGGDSASSNVAFAHSDVVVNGINLGRADGGRSFCDAFGAGIPTFCRVTTEVVPVGQPNCYINHQGREVCTQGFGEMQGYRAGYSDTLVPARGSVLAAFSDGVGAETRISYLPLTDPEVYTRSNTQSNPDARILLVQPKSLAVFETRAWFGQDSGTPLVGSARYFYGDLRADTWGGSRGFRERWVLHEGANTLEHVVYFQGLSSTSIANLATDTARGSQPHDLRELGTVMCQGRYAINTALAGPPLPQDIVEDRPRLSRLSQLRRLIVTAPRANPCSLGTATPADLVPSAALPFVLLQTTTNTLGDTAPSNPRLRHVVRSETQAWDWNGSSRVAMPSSETTSIMSDMGNVTRLEQITSQGSGENALVWRKITLNAYESDDTNLWLLGRLTRATVTTQTPTAERQLAANARSAGSGEHAGAVSWPRPPGQPSTPISPAVLAVIIDLLLQD
jgi:hypothetical protein